MSISEIKYKAPKPSTSLTKQAYLRFNFILPTGVGKLVIANHNTVGLTNNLMQNVTNVLIE